MQKAYSLLSVKTVSADADHVTISGVASTPTPDLISDVVEPLGAIFKTPMPLLWMHDHSKPVGSVTFAKPTSKGIPFTAQLPILTEAGVLKDRIDEAIHSLRAKLVSAVSIGFSATADHVERLANGGKRYLQWTWHELSLVVLPMNSEATITAVKSIDRQHLADAGRIERAPLLIVPRRAHTAHKSVQLICRH